MEMGLEMVLALALAVLALAFASGLAIGVWIGKCQCCRCSRPASQVKDKEATPSTRGPSELTSTPSEPIYGPTAARDYDPQWVVTAPGSIETYHLTKECPHVKNLREVRWHRVCKDCARAKKHV